MNEEKGWINIQKQIYKKYFENCLFFRNFKDILVWKTLLDFNLPLIKQIVMQSRRWSIQSKEAES